MKKRGILVAIGLFSLQCVFAQDYAFKVLANKGTNEVKVSGVFQPLKTGDRLKKEDELKVADNAYVALVHSSGKPVELRKSGNYKIDELSSKVGGGSSSVLSKYTDFILSSNSADAKKNRLSATGAVHRGLEDIKLMLPESQNSVLSDTVSINWESKVNGPYLVTLKNMFDDELLVKETTDHHILVNMKDAKLMKESPILVEIRSKSDPKSKSEQRIVKRLPVKEADQINASLANEVKEFTEESSVKEIVKASFYEQNKLIIDAKSAYEKAIKLSPDVPTYHEYYEEFLLRNKLKSAHK